MKPADPVLITRLVLELAIAFAILAFGLVVIRGALELDIGWGDGGPQSGYVPFYLGGAICLAACAILIQAWLNRRAFAGVAFLTRSQLGSLGRFLLPIVAYVVGSVYLGLYIASAVYLACVMKFQGGYGLLRSLVTGVATSGIFFLLFEIWFRIPLLKGPLEAALGIY